MARLPVYRTAVDVPVLRHKFPLTIKSLHQIELTSLCSLRCVYCPSSQIVAANAPSRPAMDMAVPVFVRALEHVARYVKQGTQDVLNVAGIGESMMRDDFMTLMRLAREKLPLGPNRNPIPIILATNGLHMTDSIAAEMPRLFVGCWISLHRPEKAGLAIEIAKRHDVYVGISTDPATNADDWAGQVKWRRSQPYVSACMWLREGKAMVMAHGGVTTCCLDASGVGTIGHVDDAIGSLAVRPYSLCQTCAQEVAVDGYDQRMDIK